MFGSVANGTKVGEMDEYDINVILKFPFDPLRFNEYTNFESVDIEIWYTSRIW